MNDLELAGLLLLGTYEGRYLVDVFGQQQVFDPSNTASIIIHSLRILNC
jgi:hypothetical protein